MAIADGSFHAPFPGISRRNSPRWNRSISSAPRIRGERRRLSVHGNVERVRERPGRDAANPERRAPAVGRPDGRKGGVRHRANRRIAATACRPEPFPSSSLDHPETIGSSNPSWSPCTPAAAIACRLLRMATPACRRGPFASCRPTPGPASGPGSRRGGKRPLPPFPGRPSALRVASVAPRHETNVPCMLRKALDGTGSGAASSGGTPGGARGSLTNGRASSRVK